MIRNLKRGNFNSPFVIYVGKTCADINLTSFYLNMFWMLVYQPESRRP